MFLLENQFVMDLESGSIRQCIRGSGMGLCFSGEIADLVFYRLSETTFLESSRHAITSYDRSKDDIFCVFSAGMSPPAGRGPKILKCQVAMCSS